MLQSALIQETRLFIGHPTLAVTLVVGVMLVGGGIGSQLAGRWIDAEENQVPALVPFWVALTLIGWFVVWTVLSDSLRGSSGLLRALIAALSLLPMALTIGMPFPLGLRALRQELVPMAWAVNGVTTLLGSVAAVALSILIGFQAVLIAGAALYVMTSGAAYLMSRS